MDHDLLRGAESDPRRREGRFIDQAAHDADVFALSSLTMDPGNDVFTNSTTTLLDGGSCIGGGLLPGGDSYAGGVGGATEFEAGHLLQRRVMHLEEDLACFHKDLLDLRESQRKLQLLQRASTESLAKVLSQQVPSGSGTDPILIEQFQRVDHQLVHEKRERQGFVLELESIGAVLHREREERETQIRHVSDALERSLESMRQRFDDSLLETRRSLQQEPGFDENALRERVLTKVQEGVERGHLALQARAEEMEASLHRLLRRVDEKLFSSGFAAPMVAESLQASQVSSPRVPLSPRFVTRQLLPRAPHSTLSSVPTSHVVASSGLGGGAGSVTLGPAGALPVMSFASMRKSLMQSEASLGLRAAPVSIAAVQRGSSPRTVSAGVPASPCSLRSPSRLGGQPSESLHFSTNGCSSRALSPVRATSALVRATSAPLRSSAFGPATQPVVNAEILTIPETSVDLRRPLETSRVRESRCASPRWVPDECGALLGSSPALLSSANTSCRALSPHLLASGSPAFVPSTPPQSTRSLAAGGATLLGSQTGLQQLSVASPYPSSAAAPLSPRQQQQQQQTVLGSPTTLALGDPAKSSYTAFQVSRRRGGKSEASLQASALRATAPQPSSRR